MKKLEELPVLFRAERSGPFKGDVTAVFPTLEWSRGEMTCYAHIGQHGACTLGWYRGTRPAKLHEYADLLRELRGIYGRKLDASDTAYKLVVYQRMTGKAARP